jgi:hypothetical protein
MSEITKEQELEYKQIRKNVEREYKVLKKSVAPELQIVHLEKIILGYKRMYAIKTPSLSDKTAFNMVKVQYRALCLLRKITPNKACE